MKKVLLNKIGMIRFSKCRKENDLQICSYCGDRVGKGKVGLIIKKEYNTGMNVNVWIHIKCIENFARDIIKFKNENIKMLLMETI